LSAGSIVDVILTEKPSVARGIAAFMGARSRREGYMEGGGCRVTWAYGHLVELKEPHDHNVALKRWSLESLPFIPVRFELKLTKDARSRQQFNVIKRVRGDYCRARSTLSAPALHELSCEVAEELEQTSDPSWSWKDKHAKLIDGFTFTMPDTPKNQAEYPQQKTQKPGVGLPMARAVAIVSLATAPA
jgi:hypothetical protein